MTTNWTTSLLRLLEMGLVPDSDYSLPVIATVLRLLLSAVWIVVTAVYIRILVKRQVFHVNVLCLLIALPTSYAVIIVPNTILQATIRLDINISMEATVALNEITSIGIFGTTFNLFAFVFERIIASMLVHRYEYISARVPFISLLMLLVQWTGASICIALNYSGALTLLPLLVIVGVEWAMSVVMFSFLPWFSRRSYERRMKNTDRRYKHRYQYVENQKTALVLNRLVLFLSMAILLQLTYYTVMSYWLPPAMFSLLLEYFHVISALLPSIACFIVLLNHEKLREDVQELCRFRNLFYKHNRITSETVVSDGAQPQQIRSISGQNLYIPQENHHQHYNDFLKRQWNI